MCWCLSVCVRLGQRSRCVCVRVVWCPGWWWWVVNGWDEWVNRLLPIFAWMLDFDGIVYYPVVCAIPSRWFVVVLEGGEIFAWSVWLDIIEIYAHIFCIHCGSRVQSIWCITIQLCLKTLADRRRSDFFFSKYIYMPSTVLMLSYCRCLYICPKYYMLCIICIPKICVHVYIVLCVCVRFWMCECAYSEFGAMAFVWDVWWML